MADKRVPTSTYRLQFSRRFGFHDARRLLPYLADLGIDTIYASPVFRARPGSRHGYDIVDPNELNPDLGTPRDFDLLADAVRKRRMGWLQDIVPNHMAFHQDNAVLMESLKVGEHSPYFNCFDIDWDHPDPGLRGTVMAPFLERPYTECLERGDFEIRLAESGLFVTYKRYAFPLHVAGYEFVFRLRLAESEVYSGNGGGVERLVRAAAALKTAFGDPVRFSMSRVEESIADIYKLYRDDAGVREYVDEKIRHLGSQEMDKVLARQLFTLRCWRDTADVINYRRFFDVNGLIALATEKTDVHTYTHGLITRLVERGIVTGLRVDHVDGLRNPEQYLLWLGANVGRVYTVVEKILARGEHLRWWSVDGTTGYDFLNALNGLFCFRSNKDRLDEVYLGFTGFEDDPREVLYEKKKLVMNTDLGADLDNLARWLADALGEPRMHAALEDQPGMQDLIEETPPTGLLREALVETLAELTVYRTYLTPTDQSWQDGTPLAGALGLAQRRNPRLQDELRLLAMVLMDMPRLARGPGAGTGNIEYAMTLQQYTGAVMAKGFEDTFLYVYNRLLSLNEVGGDPIAFGTDPDEFHAFILARSASHPHSMNATATHDTKRGEDVRARINVLSEIPEEWGERVKRWAELNAPSKAGRKGEEIPDLNDEYALYQTLVGSYPFEDEDLTAYRFRVSRFVRKAAREAKTHTSWRDPDTAYEDGFARFAETILARSQDNGFLEDFLPFQRRIAHYGALNSLSQTLVKICAPGVPDFYQGTELWDLNLVDPDNRRPVDYAGRAVMLGGIMRGMAKRPEATIRECLDNIGDGRVKMLLIQRALAARKANSYLFRKGSYIELEAGGELADNVIAFARSERGAFAICIVPRFVTGVVGEGEFPLGPEVWGDTAVKLPPGAPRRWNDAISGFRVLGADAITVGEALRLFPVGLLMEEGK